MPSSRTSGRDSAASRSSSSPWYELADFYNKTVELFSRQVAVRAS